MAVPLWLMVGLTGFAGLVFGIYWGGGHRKRLETELDTKRQELKELSKQLGEKERLLAPPVGREVSKKKVLEKTTGAGGKKGIQAIKTKKQDSSNDLSENSRKSRDEPIEGTLKQE